MCLQAQIWMLCKSIALRFSQFPKVACRHSFECCLNLSFSAFLVKNLPASWKSACNQIGVSVPRYHTLCKPVCVYTVSVCHCVYVTASVCHCVCVSLYLCVTVSVCQGLPLSPHLWGRPHFALIIDFYPHFALIVLNPYFALAKCPHFLIFKVLP